MLFDQAHWSWWCEITQMFYIVYVCSKNAVLIVKMIVNFSKYTIYYQTTQRVQHLEVVCMCSPLIAIKSKDVDYLLALFQTQNYYRYLDSGNLWKSTRTIHLAIV